MRRCSCFVVAVVLLFGAPAYGQSRPDALSIVRQYAYALESFNPRLNNERALQLALRTVGQASDCGIDARLVVALIAVESSWNPAAHSAAGARGLGQLMPATASGLGVDAWDANANLDGTIRHLSGLLARYRALPAQARFEHAIAAYNAGAGAVDHYGGIPPYPETQNYVRRVILLWRRLVGR